MYLNWPQVVLIWDMFWISNYLWQDKLDSDKSPRCKISLVKPLKELGIEKLFQKAFIAVDEAGSVVRRPPSQKVSLRKGTRAIPFAVDHPFLFYVRDLQAGLLLFQGRVVELPSVPEMAD